MVLTNQLFLGLVLLVSVTTCLSSTSTTTVNPDGTPAATQLNPTISQNVATETLQFQPPKTEPDRSYFSGTTSTETPDERRKIDGDKTREDGGRSLDADGENNVFSESKYFKMDFPDRTPGYGRIFDGLELTTPQNKSSRFEQIQDGVVRSLEESEKMFTMELGRDDKYFYSKAPDFSGEYKADEVEKIESNESKDKNRIHRDYTVETGKKMEMIRGYNETEIIDEPKRDDSRKDVSQNEVKDETRTKEKKHVDLHQQSTDQISEVRIEKLKEPSINNNTIDVDVHTNASLNKEQLDPIISSDKEIVITKRGPKMKLKSTTPTVNLEELNIVEVTTKENNIVDVPTSTEGPLKNKPIESYDMKMINVINDNETLEQSIAQKEYTKIDETTTVEDETMSSDQINNSSVNKTETTEFLVVTTEEIPNKITTTESTTSKIIDGTTETGTVETETTETNIKTTETQNVETTTAETFDESGTNFGGLLVEILTNSTEVPPDTTTVTTIRFYDTDDEEDTTTFYEVTTEKAKTGDPKKNETISNIANEVVKIHPSTSAPFSESNEVKTAAAAPPAENATEPRVPSTAKPNENEIIKQNEINVLGDKVSKASTTEESPEKDCYPEQCEDADDEYADPNGNKKHHDLDGIDDNSEKILGHFDAKVTLRPSTATAGTNGNDGQLSRTFNVSTPRFRSVETDIEVTTTPAGLIGDGREEDDGNGGKIAAIVISTVGAVCLFLLVGLLIVMRKRQKRFNYGQRCRPVSLDAYSMDNVSIHNSTRRKGVLMMSKRSYGNAAFEDPNSLSHPLNFSEMVKFANNTEEIHNEFEQIPQVQAKTSELPDGCEVKNRYANVIPLPETRVFLSTIDGDPTSDYINANFVTGAKSERRYYIACQAPLQSTIGDFWRMIWEQESKVILMLTHLYEQGIEKCIDYLPPSEVLDCHRLFGDFQVTLKKREVRDKYIISSLQLKNMVSNSWREVTHIWYAEWPHKGVPDEANSLIRFLIEARSYMKCNEIKAREANTSFIQGTTLRNPPVTVHCSPGTGRTGTVIACDIAIREFEQSRQVDIPKIVYKIRRDRASSVQTKEQYSFIYKVINLYATKLTGGAFDSF